MKGRLLVRNKVNIHCDRGEQDLRSGKGATIMRRGAGKLVATALVALVGLLASSAALAASPRQIYNDYADNGRLDGAYSPRELQSALTDATIQGYGKPAVVAPMKAEIKRKLGGGQVAGGKEALDRPARSGTLPFTGLDLALIVGGALLLLLVGGGLRRLSRSRA
jgi:hypothetical protein